MTISKTMAQRAKATVTEEEKASKQALASSQATGTQASKAKRSEAAVTAVSFFVPPSAVTIHYWQSFSCFRSSACPCYSRVAAALLLLV